jgi:hypothetical protein
MTPTQARTHHIVVSGLQLLNFDTERRIYSLKKPSFANLNESALSASAVNATSVYMTHLWISGSVSYTYLELTHTSVCRELLESRKVECKV